MPAIRAAAYYRMSDDRQENSIDRQKSQVEPYAEKNGYNIVAVYEDLGITGSEIAGRKGLQRMLRDAQSGKFEAILCDDKDRFGRFDSIDMGEIIAPLRRKGIHINTVAQGRRDWESFGGRVTDAVMQEAKRMEQEAISRRVLSTQLLRARDGHDTGGRMLYGYCWETDSDGNRKRVPDGHRAEIVRFIFRQYDQGWTLWAIAEELYRRGMSSPTGKPRWTRSVIQRLLKNRRFVGDFTWGVHASGKCHRYAKNGLRTTSRGQHGQETNPADEWIIRPEAHEPLIDRETFERVQARLRGNQGNTTPHPNGGNFILSRMLVCGHCGSTLVGITAGKSRVYVCRGYLAHGKDYCRRNSIPEKTAVNALLRQLQQAFLDPDNLKQLRAEVAAVQAEQTSEDHLQRMRKRIEAIGRKIDQGTERLIIVPKDLIPGLAVKLRQLEQEKRELQKELHAIEAAAAVNELENRISEAENALWALQDALRAEDYPLLRQVLREMVSRVEFFWTHRQVGKVTRCRLLRGEVHLQTSEGMSELFPSAGQ